MNADSGCGTEMGGCAQVVWFDPIHTLGIIILFLPFLTAVDPFHVFYTSLFPSTTT